MHKDGTGETAEAWRGGGSGPPFDLHLCRGLHVQCDATTRGLISCMAATRFRHAWHATERDRDEAIIAGSPCKAVCSDRLFVLVPTIRAGELRWSLHSSLEEPSAEHPIWTRRANHGP